MNGPEALKNIKEIELSHVEHEQDEDIDGEWVYTDHEVYDGTVAEKYPNEIEVLEKELKDYHEIKEIAKHYHWDDFVKDTHMVDTDEKYLRLFNAAIPGIQADYRKARAFDIIKKDPQRALLISDYKNFDEYVNDKDPYWIEKELMTKDEFDLLKEVMG